MSSPDIRPGPPNPESPLLQNGGPGEKILEGTQTQEVSGEEHTCAGNALRQVVDEDDTPRIQEDLSTLILKIYVITRY